MNISNTNEQNIVSALDLLLETPYWLNSINTRDVLVAGMTIPMGNEALIKNSRCNLAVMVMHGSTLD